MIKWGESEKSGKKNSSYIYRKLFRTYTVVIIMIVLILELFFATSIQNQRKETNLRYTEMMCEDAVKYIDEMTEDIDNSFYKMYDMESVIKDVAWYLEYPLHTYMKKKLDAYSESNKNEYLDIEDFAVEITTQNEHIKQVSFISYKQEKRTDYTRNEKATKITYFPKWKTDMLKEGGIVKDGNFGVFQKVPILVNTLQNAI